MLRQIDACAEEGLVKRLVEGFRHAEALAGGLHFRPQADLSAADLLKGEHGHLHRHVFGFLLQAGLIAELPDFLSGDHCGGKVHDRDSGHLADIGHRSGGTGIDLDHVNLLAHHDELNIDQADDVQGFCQPSGILRNGLLHVLADGLGRVNGDTVSGMHARALHMLHQSGDQDIGAVADRVNLHLLALQVLVYQNGMILGDAVDDGHKFLDLCIGDGDLHALAAQHVGGAHQHGITKTVCHSLRFFRCINGSAAGSGDFTFLQNLVKQLSVFRRVHVFRTGSQNRNPHFHQAFGQLDGGLAAELHHRPVGMLDVHHILHILRRQRLKIQLVRDIEVRAHGLRIIIDDDRLITRSGKSPGGMNGAVVEFDSLSDSDGAASQHQNFLRADGSIGTNLAASGFLRLVFSAVYRVIIRRARLELRGAGIHHLISGCDAVFQAQIFDLPLRHSGQAADHVVRELQTLRLAQKLRRERALLQLLFHLHQNGDFIDEPLVHHGDLMDRLIIQSLAQGFRNDPDPLVVHLFQAFLQILRGKGGEIIASQAVHMLLQGADGLHQRPFKIGANAHHLSGGLHLGGEGSLCGDEFIEGQTGHFHHAVVQRGFKAGIGLARNRVFDLVQGIAQGDLCRHLGDGITGGLTRQCGRTAHTGIHLDDAVFKAGGMQSKLHVAASRDLQLVDDV